MTKIIAVIIGVLLLGVGVYAVTSGKQSAPRANTESFSSIQSAVQSGAKLYDVRTSQEFNAGHYEGAQNWSLQDMQAGKMPEVEKDTKIYVYCQSGNRSSQAARLLSDAGLTNVVDLGGLKGVQERGGTLQ